MTVLFFMVVEVGLYSAKFGDRAVLRVWRPRTSGGTMQGLSLNPLPWIRDYGWAWPHGPLHRFKSLLLSARFTQDRFLENSKVAPGPIP